MTRYRAWLTAAVVGVLLVVPVPQVHAGPPLDDVRAAADELNTWLGDGPDGVGWRKYLHWDEQRALLAKGDDADPAAVEAVLARYRRQTPGLELSRFVTMRKALAAWAAQLSIPAKEKLAAAITAARGKYRPVAAQQLAAARGSLDTAVRALDVYLSGPNGAGWRRYLDFAAMQRELASAAGPNLESLAAIAGKYGADQAGLDQPRFAAVRQALIHYLQTAEAADDAKGRATYDEVMDALAKDLAALDKQPTAELVDLTGLRIGWLAQHSQAPGIVAAIRKYYARQNLFVEVAEEVVAAGIRRRVDEPTEVRQVILGTDITGRGRTTGSVDLGLTPSAGRAILNMFLVGRATTQNVGYNRSVTIYSNSLTSYKATKQVLLTADGFHSLPAVAWANTSTDVTGVSAGRMATNIAWKRIGQSKGQAEQIAARVAEGRVRGRMDAEAGELLGKANRDFNEKIRGPLVERDGFPRTLRFSTTDSLLRIVAEQANGGQLAAFSPPPQIKGGYPLAVRIHESALNNLAASMLAGVTLEEESFQKDITQLLGELPDKLKSGPDEDPWSITFARRQPVTVSLADGGFTVTVRGQRFGSGDRRFRAMNVTASYKIAKTPTGMKAVRQGDLVILPPGFVEGKDRLSAGQLALRRILHRRFSKLFEPEIISAGLTLPGRWEKYGLLVVDQLSSSGGWLTAGWRKAAATDRVAERIVSP